MGVIVAAVRRQFALDYLDDNAFFSKSPLVRVELVGQVLRLLFKISDTVKLKKSRFLADHFDYFGHVILLGSLESVESTVDPVAKLGHSTVQTELRSFFCLYNGSRWFNSNFALLPALPNKS